MYKYKSDKSISIRINSIITTGDLNKHKSSISTSRHISLLHEFMINSDICYCISITVICLLY